MSIEVWATYVAIVLVFMSTPGPSQILMLSNSANHGWRRSILTAIGDLTANTLQMLAAGLGLAIVLTTYANALLAIQWLGVIYLIWLGIRMITKSSSNDLQGDRYDEKPSLRMLWLQGFITSAANPKAVVFFAALFPQFMASNFDFVSQFLILTATYIVIDGCFLTAYGMGACWVVSRIVGESKLWIQRLGAASMLFAAILLGLKTISV